MELNARLERKKKQLRINALRSIAQEINSPLSIQDIGILIDYGTISTPLDFTHYMIIKLVWDGLTYGKVNTSYMKSLSLIDMYNVVQIETLTISHCNSIESLLESESIGLYR